MKYVRLIASADQNIRKNAIINSLAGIGVPYFIQEFEDASNIVVSQNPSSRRLVIGAPQACHRRALGQRRKQHGRKRQRRRLLSPFARHRKTRRQNQKSIDFVFFDKEESGNIGSKRYIEAVGKENIAAMVNLDLCGYGDNIAVYEKGNRGNEKFFGLLSDEVLVRHGVSLLSLLPNGDDRVFEQNGIHSISVCMLDEPDLKYFKIISQKIRQNIELTEEDHDGFMKLKVKNSRSCGCFYLLFCSSYCAIAAFIASAHSTRLRSSSQVISYGVLTAPLYL